MIPWWIAIITFYVGAFFGVMCIALVSANGKE